MKFEKKLTIRFCTYVIFFIIGITLILFSMLSILNDSALPLGIGFSAVSIAKIVQYRMITKNKESLNQRKITETDERNILLSDKAKSLAFTIFLCLCGIMVMVFYLISMPFVAQIIAYTLCGLLFIYVITFFILQKTN